MLIRKNTKAFKTIMQIVSACQDRPDREKLVRLYITRAGHSIDDRISIEHIQGEAALFYEMNYQTVFSNLKSSNHQLHTSDDLPGIYFFRTTGNKVWDEAPFEFDEAIKEEFSSLPDLPVTRQKEKSKAFVLSPANIRTIPKTSKGKTAKVPARTETAAKQPGFKLKHDIQFSNLDKIIFRHPQVTKRDVLGYYERMAEWVLPYLKERPLWTRLHSNGSGALVPMTIEGMLKDQGDDLPGWIKVTNDKNKKGGELLSCSDKEHLLFYVESGCLEFHPLQARMKSPELPDYIIIALDSPDSELSKVIEVAHATKDVLEGLQLPSFPKTDGKSGLHIYVPLDSKEKFETAYQAAEYVCKLVRLKIPELISLKGVDGYVYGKVSVDYTLNTNAKGVIAPYSIVSGELAAVAAPLSWDEVTSGLRVEDFHHETILSRLKNGGDPFATLFKRKVNADELLSRLDENYSFLF